MAANARLATVTAYPARTPAGAVLDVVALAVVRLGRAGS